MKQPIEVYADFAHLNEYFKNIELLADKLGVDIDELIEEDLRFEKKVENRKVIYLKHFGKK
jgi:hypothetical protein